RKTLCDLLRGWECCDCCRRGHGVLFSPLGSARCGCLSLPTLRRTHGLIRCQHRMCEKRIINERRRIAIAPFRVLGCRRSVFHDCYLETLFQQLSQMGFDTHVGQHSAEDDPADPPFAWLQNEVIRLWPKYPMRRYYDGFAVFDVRLKTLQPV